MHQLEKKDTHSLNPFSWDWSLPFSRKEETEEHEEIEGEAINGS